MTKKKIRFSIVVWILAVVMALSVVCAAFTASYSTDSSGNLSAGTATDTFSPFIDKDKAIADLRKDMIKSINKDLIKNIADYRLSGKVNAIITFSENSLVNEYNEKHSGSSTLEDYLQSSSAKSLAKSMTERQNKAADKLVKAGLVSAVKYGYTAIADGVYVTTTYENLNAIMQFDEVSRIIVSNTYMPAVATENPVNVYDTGIFNSSDVDYTGKGTIVAVLDTGCDYTHTAFTTHKVEQPLYGRNDIARILPQTVAYGYDNTVEPREVYYGNITNNKIAWGYDYADKDPDVMPFSSEHGTHVAGIIGGKDDVITGVAVDAQLAIMKVFSDYKDGADDGDILAALEDCVKLGVDAINMSLGTSCGFTREVDEVRKNEIYDSIEEAGISLVVAASNDYSSAYGSEFGNTNKTRNPDSATVGAPSTYNAAMSVASINGNKDKYMLANGNQEVFFLESFNQSAKEYNFFEMMGITEGVTKTFDYVTVPGYGYAANYIGTDVKGKIALVKRGDISFEEKARFAAENGAVACIIYNNVFGDIIMTVGNDITIPVVSIGKDDGDILASVNKGKENEGIGTLEFSYSNQAGPFMSDFSSWGPNPDLSLKPEITAHGGNIYSAVPGGGYDKLSGTSMACPNMCGITVLIRQYVKENFPSLTTTCEVRDLVNQLCMSTATIALDRKGNPYSPRKQGAGIADILKATTTDAYLYVDGMGKTKLELGDDPQRNGVYTMSVNLKNISDKSVSYTIGNLAMTESVSSSDKDYVAEMAYMLDVSADYNVKGGTLNGGVVTVPAGQTATVTATITLSGADKRYINGNFENGMYVEGFLTFTNTDDKGVSLNAPFLAFYGDWADAPIFDEDYYMVETEAHNGAIDEEDKIKADYYATTPLGKYYYDYIIPLGSYMYDMSPDDVAIPATAEHAAISYYRDCISGVYSVFTGLLRGAKEMNIEIVDTATGKTVWQKTEYNAYKAHFNGAQMPYVCNIDLDMVDFKTNEVFGDNNSHYQVTMSAKMDWDNGERNVNDTYKFSFYIDYQAPLIVDSKFSVEYDRLGDKDKDKYFVELTVYDNHYAMSLRPVVVYSYVDENGQTKQTFSSLAENPLPVYQEKRDSKTVVKVDITDYLDVIRSSNLPQGITFYVDDYAMNSAIYYIPFPETQCNTLGFKTEDSSQGVPTIELKKGETFDLTTVMYDTADENREIDRFYLKNLTWTSSNPDVVAVSGGQIEALQNNEGIVISVKGETWDKAKTVRVNIVGENAADGSSSQNTELENIEFISYDTVFAYNGDIDRSEIGRTGGKGFFDGNYTLNFYPGEQVKLNYLIEPWNLDPARYELKWSSSNERVATVDENGVVKGLAEGRTRVSLNIIVDGRQSILQARCTVNIKNEFVIENRELVAYKGLGGVVEIPDDEGILYIGSFAFCHYNLVNDKDVGDDYDFDDKKEPLRNNTVTKVIIPAGVEEIRKFAFYNCEVLEEVVLGEDCDKIYEYAFYNNVRLININLDRVKVISDYAFYGCRVLQNPGFGINFESVNVLGNYSFANCVQLTSANLTDLRRSGEGAFYGCSHLTTVVLGERARLAPQMFAASSLREITVYSDTIPDKAFYNCTRLTKVTVVNDLTYLGTDAFSGCVQLNSFTFKKGCEYIGSAAFYGCAKLSAIVLPDGITSFGDNVFGNCASLTTLILNANTVINEVGALMFNALGGTNVAFSAANSNHYSVKDGILFSKDGTELILALTNKTFDGGIYVLPENVKVIADGAFSGNRNLNVLDASVSQLEKIGNSAFAYCANLTAVKLGDNAVAIDDRAFTEAVNLKNIDLSKCPSIGEFAFYNTALTAVTVGDGATVGYRAFSVGKSTVLNATYTSKLINLYLGKNAKIGDYAFANTAVATVEMPADGGVVIGQYAFFNSSSLVRIDLTKATELSAYSFAMCSKLARVDLGNIAVIPEGCFSGCASLVNVTADNAEKVEHDAFAQFELVSGGQQFVYEGPAIVTIILPKAIEIGEYAFYGCMDLETVSLPEVETIGEGAFEFCEKLQNVTFGSKLSVINDGVFYGCSSLNLAEFDFDNITKVGKMSFLGTQVPETLTLPKVESIDVQAFCEAELVQTSQGLQFVPVKNPHLKTVNAPELRFLLENAFYGSGALQQFNAPKLEEIGSMVFVDSLITEFEVTDNLRFVDYGAFTYAEKFETFYATVNGQKVFDVTFSNVMLDKGVLYTSTNKGYMLSSYPAAKTDAEYAVPEGVVRIEFLAAYGNKNITKIVLPQTLTNIGNMSFYSCDKLATVEFRSYYAPVLEGTMSGELDILPGSDLKDRFPGFDKLYKYDYYYYTQLLQLLANPDYKPSFGVPYPLYYATFVDFVTSKKASNLQAVLPVNSEGYDSALYTAYFNTITKSQFTPMGGYAIAFINAVNNLPDVVDRFAAKSMGDAITAYNALQRHTDELAAVDKSVVDRYQTALSAYNVDVAINAINKLVGIDSTDRSINLVEKANSAYNVLSAEEKDLITNYDKLVKANADLEKAIKERNEELEAERKKAAQAAIDAIDAIGEVSSAQSCFDRLSQALNVFNALTTEEKAYVTNSDKLQAAVTSYNTLVKTINTVNAEVTKTATNVTLQVAGILSLLAIVAVALKNLLGGKL